MATEEADTQADPQVEADPLSMTSARLEQRDEVEGVVDLEEVRAKHKEYVEELRGLGLHALVCEIQPKWNNRNVQPADGGERLFLALEEYKRRDGDMEYFTSGAGASSGDGDGGYSCSVL